MKVPITEMIEVRRLRYMVFTPAYFPISAIRRSALWYNELLSKHYEPLKKPPPVVVLLTDDTENRSRAVEENVPAMSGVYLLSSFDEKS